MPYGFSRCEVRIDSADSLARGRLPAALPSSAPTRGTSCLSTKPSDTRSPLYFRSALSPLRRRPFTLDVVPVNQTGGIQPSKYAFVVLSDVLSLPPAFESSLLSYVRNGGSVLIAAGTSSASRPRDSRHRRQHPGIPLLLSQWPALPIRR